MTQITEVSQPNTDSEYTIEGIASDQNASRTIVVTIPTDEYKTITDYLNEDDKKDSKLLRFIFLAISVIAVIIVLIVVAVFAFIHFKD